MMKITGLSHLFKWENLHNWWLTKYFFAPLYMCFCAEVVFFLFSHCTPQWSIVWGLNFFSSSLSSCKILYFSYIPCLPVLSAPLSYVCCVCMDRLMANFAGTCY